MSGERDKVYTTTEKSFLRHIGRGMWVGSEFADHGQAMVITEIGQAYRDGKVKLVDIKAVNK